MLTLIIRATRTGAVLLAGIWSMTGAVGAREVSKGWQSNAAYGQVRLTERAAQSDIEATLMRRAMCRSGNGR